MDTKLAEFKSAILESYSNWFDFFLSMEIKGLPLDAVNEIIRNKGVPMGFPLDVSDE